MTSTLSLQARAAMLRARLAQDRRERLSRSSVPYGLSLSEVTARPSSARIVDLMDGYEAFDSSEANDLPGIAIFAHKVMATPDRPNGSMPTRGERPRVGRSRRLLPVTDKRKLRGGKQRERHAAWVAAQDHVRGTCDSGARLPGSATVRERWRISAPSLTLGPRSERANPDYAESLFYAVQLGNGEVLFVHRETGETYEPGDRAVDWRTTLGQE